MKMRMLPLVLAIGVLALSGCSSADSTTTPSAAVPSTTSTTDTPVANANTCGDTADTVKQKVSRPEVKSVEVIGSCTMVMIKSTLADGDGDTAAQICEAAAEVAYTGDINNVTIQGKSGKELAIGIKGAPCHGEQ